MMAGGRTGDEGEGLWPARARTRGRGGGREGRRQEARHDVSGCEVIFPSNSLAFGVPIFTGGNDSSGLWELVLPESLGKQNPPKSLSVVGPLVTHREHRNCAKQKENFEKGKGRCRKG